MPDTTPEATPPPTNLTTAELIRISKLFVSHSVDKIRLTGGEPLLNRDIIPLTQALSAYPVSIGITTNGILLPRLLPRLISAGLNSVNLSLDTLHPERFELLTRRKGHSRVLDAMEQLAESPIRAKVNVVVMKDINHHELTSFVDLTKSRNLDVRFIEYMPFDGNRWAFDKFFSYANMLHVISGHFGTLLPQHTHASDTTKYFRVPGFRGRIGFITSMTNHFCAGCNRLRITADGNLKVCLFGKDELSLRDAMRAGASDQQIEILVQKALAGKHFALGGNKDMFDISKSDNRSMVRIGG